LGECLKTSDKAKIGRGVESEDTVLDKKSVGFIDVGVHQVLGGILDEDGENTVEVCGDCLHFCGKSLAAP